MKILHVLDHSVPLQSGYAFRTLSILRNQRAMGLETTHLTSPKHYVATKDNDEAEGLLFYRTLPESNLVNRFPMGHQMNTVRLLKRRLFHLAKNIKPDIIHAHSPALNGIAAIIVGKKLGIPVVYEMRASWEDAAVDHGTTREGSIRYSLSRGLETWVLRHVNAIVTIATGLKEDILSRGIPGTSITLAPNAIDLNQFTFTQDEVERLRSKLSLRGKKTIGFIGSFYAYEGLDLLVSAFSELKKEQNNLNLLLVGGGLQEESLKQQVTELGLSDVTFTGRVPHDDVTLYYQLIDIFVYPRYAMRLTELVTPLKPLEAMANRGVIIASNVGGHRELIENGKTGLLFSPGSCDDLVNTIQQVLNDSIHAKELAETGRKFVEKERNWKKIAEIYLPIYNRLTKSS